jgi:hypothetical protein
MSKPTESTPFSTPVPRGRPRGWRAPDARREMINVRLTTAEVDALDRRAAADGTSRSAVLRSAALAFLGLPPCSAPRDEIWELRKRVTRLEVQLRVHAGSIIVTPADTKESLRHPLHLSAVEAARLRGL